MQWKMLKNYDDVCDSAYCQTMSLRYHFYRAMHFSAKRGIAIACRLSVRLYVRISVCNVGGL